MNPFSSFIGGRSYLGVDIGTTSIKIAEVKKGAGLPELVNYGILESYGHLKRLNDSIQTSSLKIAVTETAELLRTLVLKSKFKTREAIASLPAFSAFLSFMDLPLMPKAEMMNALRFQIPQYIPLPPEETSIDWFKVGEYKDEKGIMKQQILLVAIPKEKVLSYQEIFKQAGLTLRFLEVESLSLARVLAANQKAPVLLLDIGSRSTDIVIVDRGFVRHSAQTDFAGASLTQAIGNGLGLNVARAEELKKQRGLLVKTEEKELSTLMLPFLDAIINEVKRAQAAFEKNHDLRAERIVLAGSGAKLLGITSYIEEQTGLKTSIGNPFLLLNYPTSVEVILNDLGPTLAVAIGLGIKEFV